MIDLAGVGSAFDFAGSLLDRFFPKKMDESDRLAMQAQLSQAIDQRDVDRDAQKRDILVAEMGQDDAFTKRARPAVVYMGLVFIGLVHVVFPILFYLAGLFKAAVPELPAICLPQEFWWAWSGICSVWVLGRSAEKTVQTKGAAGKVLSMITGNKNQQGATWIRQ